MSREGRWRLAMAVLRSTTVLLVCVGVIGAAWYVARSTHENVGVPMKPPVLKTDGVLDDAWLAGALALPKNTTLAQLDLERLRARLLSHAQIVNATLTRQFPDRLIVQASERMPIARVTIASGAGQKAYLVARDGVIYDGVGYDRSTTDALPWLDGIDVVPQGGGFRPIQGMAAAAELLAKARLEAEHLYNTWAVVSLAHLVSDHQIEVRTKNGPCVIRFNTRDDYFRQLAKLNYIWDQITRIPDARATIDLTLGRDVPVMVENGAPAGPGAKGPATQSSPAPHETGAVRPLRTADSTPGFFVFPHPQPNSNKREL